MQFTHFVTFVHANPDRRISAQDYNAVATLVAHTPALRRARLYTPAQSGNYYFDDGPSPALCIQLNFDTLIELEANIAANGYLHRLAQLPLDSLAGELRVTHQVMARRPFPVADPQPDAPDDAVLCTFLVHYPGQAEDFDAWINYYLSHHPQIMKDFPGVREIEIFTRVDWLDAMPWERVHYMQRNQLVYDTPETLAAAQNSDVIRRMRADYAKFPPFDGRNLHYPMLTKTFFGDRP